MTKIVAISGKGGTGKTILSAMLIRYLIDTRNNKSILAVDADPDANLSNELGVKVDKTIGDIKEYMERNKIDIPGDKMLHFEAKVMESLVEEKNFDFLVMGRSEGPGCYCYVNNLLREAISNLVDNYDYVVIDTGAGLEHFSRQVIKDIDTLLIITDQSKNSINTARSIKEISDELNLNIKNIYIVANKVSNKSVVDLIKKYASEISLELIGALPLDDNIVNIDLNGKTIFEIPKESPIYKEVIQIAKKIGLP
ncbi:MAG: ATP-binding protein [Candidatus Methanoliparum thermophilum]|uniref:ATP-binding protein n=1 Tax=Methanoliparum thermophilum TaxID=2491083 RepID=A0A520KRX7_METT2|nr:AAA family ATPase [Candidatus Methanoliparum sp. LAM-1]RZN64546.1 MAG: ATP-binding protein [Candidatus Methanoliparum thermophilum]BDC35856.1 ATP-binding protein [Candidatus Methanoliparum sp. LAM-1]